MNTEWQVHSTQSDRQSVIDCVARLEPRLPDIGDRFYEHLFARMPATEMVFKGSRAFRRRKFANFFATFRSCEYFEKLAPLFESMGERHTGYHRQFQNFMPAMEAALLDTLQESLGENFTPSLRTAWKAVYADIAGVMTRLTRTGMDERRAMPASSWSGEERRGAWRIRTDDGLLEAIGGEQVIRQVHRTFYYAMFQDPWIGQFFYGKHEELLIAKQTEFMVSAFGGEHRYRGPTPAAVHAHMFVTADVADLRERYLRRAILAHGLSEEIADRWLAVDRFYRPAIVKESRGDCLLLCVGQMAVTARKPENYVEPAVLPPPPA